MAVVRRWPSAGRATVFPAALPGLPSAFRSVPRGLHPWLSHSRPAGANKAWHPCPRITPRSGDVIEILRQRPLDRHFEEASGLRVDDLGAVGGEETTDLLLGTKGEHPGQARELNSRQEQVRVLRHRRVFG